jgi:hypothetical protein
MTKSECQLIAHARSFGSGLLAVAGPARLPLTPSAGAIGAPELLQENLLAPVETAQKLVISRSLHLGFGRPVLYFCE